MVCPDHPICDMNKSCENCDIINELFLYDVNRVLPGANPKMPPHDVKKIADMISWMKEVVPSHQNPVSPMLRFASAYDAYQEKYVK